MEEVRDPESNLVVVLKCNDGVVTFSTVAISPHLNTTIVQRAEEDDDRVVATSLFLNDEEREGYSNTLPIVDLGPGLLGVTAGKPGDSQVLRMRLEAMAQQMVDDDLDDRKAAAAPIARLARQLADYLQIPTQKTIGRQGPLLSVSSSVNFDHPPGVRHFAHHF